MDYFANYSNWIKKEELLGHITIQQCFEKLVYSSKTFHLTLFGKNSQNELRAIRSCLYR